MCWWASTRARVHLRAAYRNHQHLLRQVKLGDGEACGRAGGQSQKRVHTLGTPGSGAIGANTKLNVGEGVVLLLRGIGVARAQ